MFALYANKETKHASSTCPYSEQILRNYSSIYLSC